MPSHPLGRLTVKLRLMLSPHAELSNTSSTFSELTALPRLLPGIEFAPLPSSPLPSKLTPEAVALCADDGGTVGENGPTLIEASVPLLTRPLGPSIPYVMKEFRESSASVGDNNADDCFRSLPALSSSSIKTSGPNRGMVVIRPDFFFSMCFLNLRVQYL